MKKNRNLKVSIVMGSQSDYKTMKLSARVLKKMGIKYETKIISAHRTPKRMFEFAGLTKRNNSRRRWFCSSAWYDSSSDFSTCVRSSY